MKHGKTKTTFFFAKPLQKVKNIYTKQNNTRHKQDKTK